MYLATKKLIIQVLPLRSLLSPTCTESNPCLSRSRLPCGRDILPSRGHSGYAKTLSMLNDASVILIGRLPGGPMTPLRHLSRGCPEASGTASEMLADDHALDGGSGFRLWTKWCHLSMSDYNNGSRGMRHSGWNTTARRYMIKQW